MGLWKTAVATTKVEVEEKPNQVVGDYSDSEFLLLGSLC